MTSRTREAGRDRVKVAPSISLHLPLRASVLNPDPTAGPSAPTPYRDSQGVGLCEEQVASLEVIIEVEEPTGKQRRQEAVRAPPRPRPAKTAFGPCVPTCQSPERLPTYSLDRCRLGAPASIHQCQGPGHSCLRGPGDSGPCAALAHLGCNPSSD